MIYDVRHVTTYGYESAVSFARCSLRLEPKSGDGQQLVSHSVEIRPRPAERTVRYDFFGTHTESVLIETAHRSLRIDSRSRVSVSRHAPDRAAPSPLWESVRDVAFDLETASGTTSTATRQLIAPVRGKPRWLAPAAGLAIALLVAGAFAAGWRVGARGKGAVLPAITFSQQTLGFSGLNFPQRWPSTDRRRVRRGHIQ